MTAIGVRRRSIDAARGLDGDGDRGGVDPGAGSLWVLLVAKVPAATGVSSFERPGLVHLVTRQVRQVGGHQQRDALVCGPDHGGGPAAGSNDRCGLHVGGTERRGELLDLLLGRGRVVAGVVAALDRPASDCDRAETAAAATGRVRAVAHERLIGTTFEPSGAPAGLRRPPRATRADPPRGSG